MPDDTTPTTPITETKIRAAFKDGDHAGFRSERFTQIEQLLMDALRKQEAEKGLYIITKGALGLRCSDVHYDCTEEAVHLRMRIDGRLVKVCDLPHREYRLLLERLKYNSGLKLNITNVPQDGKYTISDDTSRIDVRVSTLPVKHGENVVCRILDSGNSIPAFWDLGFMWTSKRKIDQSLTKKQGMIIVTGPTGSGKTTTLYSILSSLNVPEKKIITLEDPIEYDLPGIVQSEVNEKSGYTYSSGLKALLRQDPDIIMIGEIRNLDTATIATQASLTGHLVLSTLHTKSAVDTLERLLNIGVPPYVIASSIDIIIAQRLVRRICSHCIETYDADQAQNEIIAWMMKDIGIEAVSRASKTGFKLYRGKGCEECGGSGYRGRLGVYEVFSLTDALRAMIRENRSPQEIMLEARKNDFILMKEDGILKAMRGKTTLDELFSTVDV